MISTACVLQLINEMDPSGLRRTCVTRSSESSESENWTERPARGFVDSMAASAAEGDEDMASGVIGVRAVRAIGAVGLAAKGTRKPWAVAMRDAKAASVGSRSCMSICLLA